MFELELPVFFCKDCSLPTGKEELDDHDKRCWACDYAWRLKMRELGGADDV